MLSPLQKSFKQNFNFPLQKWIFLPTKMFTGSLDIAWMIRETMTQGIISTWLRFAFPIVVVGVSFWAAHYKIYLQHVLFWRRRYSYSSEQAFHVTTIQSLLKLRNFLTSFLHQTVSILSNAHRTTVPHRSVSWRVFSAVESWYSRVKNNVTR